MNTNTIPAPGKSGYQGYWPGHLEELEFDPDICKAELKEQAKTVGIELTEDELNKMVQTEVTLW